MKIHSRETVSGAQLSALRTAAGQAGDLVQVVMCDVAMGADLPISRDDYAALTPREWSRVSSLSLDGALAACVDVINDAAGQVRS